MQVSSDSLTNPLLHVQPEMFVAPWAEVELDGHDLQPTDSSPYVFATHSQSVKFVDASETVVKSVPHDKHAWLPAVSLYVPILHAVHGPPSGPVYPELHAHTVPPAADIVISGAQS